MSRTARERPGRIVTATGLLTVVLATPVGWAGGSHERGWLLGGGWGEADYHAGVSDFDDGSLTSGSIDNHELAWKLFVGFRFNRSFSLEAGYLELRNDLDAPTFQGTSDGTGTFFVSLPDGPVSAGLAPEGYFAAGVIGLPLGRRLFLLGKVGALRWSNETAVQDLRGVTREREQATDLVYGTGLEYRLRFGLALRGEFEKFDDVAGHDIDVISGGLSWTF